MSYTCLVLCVSHLSLPFSSVSCASFFHPFHCCNIIEYKKRQLVAFVSKYLCSTIKLVHSRSVAQSPISSCCPPPCQLRLRFRRSRSRCWYCMQRELDGQGCIGSKLLKKAPVLGSPVPASSVAAQHHHTRASECRCASRTDEGNACSPKARVLLAGQLTVCLPSQSG